MTNPVRRKMPSTRQRSLIAILLGLAVGFWTAGIASACAHDLQAQFRTIFVGGVRRSYLLHLPPRLISPSPLVLVFHGGGGRPFGIMRTSGMNDIADAHHFVVAYPAGMEHRNGRGDTWDVGGAWSPSSAHDVTFVRALVADIERYERIDPRRVYATGESMGGIFVYRLACEMSNTFAAIAPVAATMVEPDCHPRSPVAVLHIHGTDDQNIPLDGGAGTMTAVGRSWPSAMRAIALWAHFDRCGRPDISFKDGPETTCTEYGHCRANVEYCLVAGGGHAWPGSTPLRWQRLMHVHVSQTFPASRRIWAFFAANPKRLR